MHRVVKRTILILTAVLPLLGYWQAGAADDESGAATAPDFVLKSTAGPNLRLSEYRGEVAMLAFWASWCGECRTQLQQFEELHHAYGGSGLRMLTINLDPGMEQGADTAASLGLSIPVLHDPDGEVAELYEVSDLPLVVYVDRDGALRERIEGYSRGESERFVTSLRELLRE
jgi:peroxiredoxin